MTVHTKTLTAHSVGKQTLNDSSIWICVKMQTLEEAVGLTEEQCSMWTDSCLLQLHIHDH